MSALPGAPFAKQCAGERPGADKEEQNMDLKTAICQRRSIRGFTDRPVERETLRQVLTLAGRAVSAVNAQPWEFAVVTGTALGAIRREYMERLERNDPGGLPLLRYGEGIFRERRVAVGKQLFAAMGIAREDTEKRRWWSSRGYRFFDAPAVILLMMDETADDYTCRLDMGCVVQNLCLAATEYGLGTCVAYQAVHYPDTLRRHLPCAAGKRFVCGVAIGYPDEGFPANAVVTDRADVDSITSWYGFDT